MTTPLNATNFGYFAFDTASPLLSKKDQQIALALSVVMGVFTVVIGHLIASIVYAVKQRGMKVLLAEKNDLLDKVEEAKRQAALKNEEDTSKRSLIFNCIERNFGYIFGDANILNFNGGAVFYKIESGDQINVMQHFKLPRGSSNQELLAQIKENITAIQETSDLKVDAVTRVACAIVVKTGDDRYQYFKQRSHPRDGRFGTTGTSGVGSSFPKLLGIISSEFPCRFDNEFNFLD